MTCPMPAAFVVTPYALPGAAARLVGFESVSLLPIQLHAIWLSLFASLVAPFGGFFASGIKRAYKLDDFASLIPGHGGVYDRLDCQLIMGLATQAYYVTFIAGPFKLSPARVLSLALALSL